MKKNIIGVLPLVDTQKDSLWMLPGYFKGIEEAGGIPIMLPLTEDDATIEQLVDTCDAFLFTGGHDVSPTLYKEEVKDTCGEISKERDEMELKLFLLAYKKDKPMFGICRGIQFFNAALGGTLYQDLPTEHKNGISHQQKPPYDKPSHSVIIEQDSPLLKLSKKTEILVNSYHHQAIKDLSPNLTVMAYSEDGLIEAVYDKTKKFLWAVQWHPEFDREVNPLSRALFLEFLLSTEIN